MQRRKILSSVAAENFIGRTRELETLLKHGKGESKEIGLVLLSAPGMGASELLKQTFDRLFYEQTEIVPFYFALKNTNETADEIALRFLQNFLQQTIAFRHKEEKILRALSDFFELAQLAAPEDRDFINHLISIRQNESRKTDERAFVKNCLSAPIRAAAHGARTFVMIDNLHEAAHLPDKIDLIEELKEVFNQSDVPFVLAGKRRFLFQAAQTGNTNLSDAEILRLEPLSFTGAGNLAEKLAEKNQVKINEQTRDLIAVQFQGNPTFIKFLMLAAGERKIDLDSFQRVEQIYADELFGGRIGKFYDSVFDRIMPEAETRKNITGLLYDALTVEKEKTSAENWLDRTGLDETDFHKTISLLNIHEIVRESSNQIEAMGETEALSDYIKARFRLEITAENRALVVGEMLSEFLKRAPKTMAQFYRRNSVIGLRELLSVFNCQEISRALLDYAVFKENLKGLDAAEIKERIESETEKIVLPQIVYAAHTVSFYPPIGKVTEKERSAVALGFEECKYTDEDEIVWIAAEIDSKLEATKETTEFWCDRLEMVALMCNFLRYKLWLVAPEGFSPEAMEILSQRNAFGTSHKQAGLLKKLLKVESADGEKTKANEYEMVVPMGDDTELIAAHAVEEIARRHSFNPKAINQIKTAMVEACINAIEHSHSPDRKIYQKFTVENDKIVITISNRGLRLSDRKAEEINPDEGRRGWGLKLIKTLMDEVKFEQVDDGTRISMVKYLKNS